MPVLGIDRVARREFLLRLDDEFREPGLAVDLDDAHAEVRRDAVVGIVVDEGLVHRRGIFVAQLAEVELAKIAVDLVGIAAMPVIGEVLVDDLGPAEVGEAQAHDAEGVRHAVLLVFLVSFIEVVADRLAIIEHRHVLVQRLFVELLLVERPAELVQPQLVVGRGASHGDDRAVRALRVHVFLAHEVVLAAAEVHLVDVPGVGILGDQAIHDLHGFVGLPDLVVGARHLVQDLVVALVIRVGLEDLAIRLDGFARTGRDGFAAGTREQVVVRRHIAQEVLSLRCALFEFTLGLVRLGRRCNGRGGIGPRERRCGLRRCHLGRARRLRRGRGRGRDLDDFAAADDAVSLLDLQVGEPAHRLGCPGALRGLFEVATVAFGRAFQAVLEVNLLDVGLYAGEFGQRALRLRRGAACKPRGRGTEKKADPPDHWTSLLACAWVARS